MFAPRPIEELEARLAAAPADTSTSTSDERVARVDALTELAWALRGADVQRAQALAREARELAREQGYTLGEARAVRTLSMTITAPEQIGDVFELAEQARRLFDEAGDDVGRAASRDFLATLHEHTGDPAGGLALALDALAIAREVGDPVRQGYALSNVGGILAAAGETATAVGHLEEALALFEGVGDPAGVGAISSRLAKLHKETGDRAQARRLAARCVDIAEETGDSFLASMALDLRAQIADSAEEAERLYRRALGLLGGEPVTKVVGAETRVALGRLLLEQGRLDEAEAELSEALADVDGEAVLIMVEAAAHEALAELRERRGQLAAAIEHLRQAQALRQRVAQQDARNRLQQIEVRAAMDAATKDAELQKSRLAELQRMQSKLVEAERMAVLGRLAAGTAHELNTPLGALRSDARLAATATERLLALADNAAAKETAKLADVIAACQASSEEARRRIGAIARSFERFSQLDQAEQRPFDVREGLDAALALLEPTVDDGITLARRFAEVPTIHGWPRELNHAFMTVLQNALEAIDGEGVVTAEAEATAQRVIVRVRDTGRGMTAPQIARLFDVDWSAEGTRTKMRLGLSAAYTTMQKHGGALEVQSAPGEGTVVEFRFPLER